MVNVNTNKQSRRWNITINNPEEHSLSIEQLKKGLRLFQYKYFCFSKEIGEKTQTEHFHIYLETGGGLRFSTIKNRFPYAHIEMALGTAQQNKEYISKSGKWRDTEKARTLVYFYEEGTIPSSKETAAEAKEHLIQLIKEGKTTAQIISENPAKYAYHIRHIEEMRQELLKEEYSEKLREVKTYIVMGDYISATLNLCKKHGYSNICRITSYKLDNTPVFDNYNQQTILLLDNPPKVPLQLLINLQSPLPYYLPCRFQNKVTVHETLYIIVSDDWIDFYREDQVKNPELWEHFINGIEKVYICNKGGILKEVEY